MASAAERERILVVDDTPDALELIERNLTASGYRVFTAPGAVEAIRILDGTPVDLVITDLIIGPSPLEPALATWLRKPSDHAITRMLLDGAYGRPVAAACIYGCKVEADGTCEHGHPSWLLKLGYI